MHRYEKQCDWYRFSGQNSFSDINSIDNVKTYGDRYDYVLTRYSKADADAISKDGEGFIYIMILKQ